MLSQSIRGQIIGQYKMGVSGRQIAKNLSLSVATVARIVALFRQTGSVAPKLIPGRPRKISARDTRALKRSVLSNRRLSSKKMAGLCCTFVT